jgi:hypothetical protein
LSLRNVFEVPTIRGLAALIDSQRPSAAAVVPGIRRVDRQRYRDGVHRVRRPVCPEGLER